MTCQELVELITDYVEGALAPDERRRFEEHLAQCAGCRAYLRQMEQTIRTVGKLAEEDVPATAQQELLQAFRDWKKQA